MGRLNLIIDKFDGITIDNTNLPNSIEKFEFELQKVLANTQEKKLLWIKITIEKSNFIPILAKYNFFFHHCNDTDIMLLKKLTNDPVIPTAKNHTLGVGAVVIDNNKLLVIKDRFNIGYKLPGGHIDADELISKALVREVYEETGVHIEFNSVISLGHFTQGQFNESNLYILCTGTALSKKIDIQDTHEIREAKWLEIDKFLACENVYDYNKKIVKEALATDGLKKEPKNILTRLKTKYELYF